MADGKPIRCYLSPNYCRIAPGKGLLSRRNDEGVSDRHGANPMGRTDAYRGWSGQERRSGGHHENLPGSVSRRHGSPSTFTLSRQRHEGCPGRMTARPEFKAQSAEENGNKVTRRLRQSGIRQLCRLGASRGRQGDEGKGGRDECDNVIVESYCWRLVGGVGSNRQRPVHLLRRAERRTGPAYWLAVTTCGICCLYFP